ncbi:uncharacterized protein ATNIH1004_001963 [Aspergillus tanneri]|uniref:Uncharacterized protein n=1 Tax=Aspergillus tanneri TaxID=1220188 RepID=A0A5M9M3T8_9EURO|nr:uncharacterized protein ATNIH1004_001963 [Aspergillus tanneri]KAA8641361.1 hypothetical protein ATNIH1004_001963 [Aspergillus tanneri]
MSRSLKCRLEGTLMTKPRSGTTKCSIRLHNDTPPFSPRPRSPQKLIFTADLTTAADQRRDEWPCPPRSLEGPRGPPTKARLVITPATIARQTPRKDRRQAQDVAPTLFCQYCALLVPQNAHDPLHRAYSVEKDIGVCPLLALVFPSTTLSKSSTSPSLPVSMETFTRRFLYSEGPGQTLTPGPRFVVLTYRAICSMLGIVESERAENTNGPA